MDTMVIWWLIAVLGMSAGSGWAIKKEYNKLNDKNDTAIPSMMKEMEHTFKTKRQLHDFDFDISSFDEPIFTKMSGISTFSDDDISDLSVFIPSSSFKVTRSNSDSLGTHGQTFEASNLSPASTYHSTSQSVKPQSSNTQSMLYSGEDQATLSQVSKSNAINNQVTTPYYDGFMNQPKPSVFSNENTYTPTAKIQFSAYPAITDFTSSIPILTLPIQAAASTNYHQADVSASQNTPYKAQLPHNMGLQAATKVYAPLHRHDQVQQNQQFESQFSTFGQNPYDVHYAATPSVDLNGKQLALPVLQIQTPDISSYIQALESAPVIFGAESGLHYKAEPNFAFDFSKPKSANINQRSGTNSPFLVATNPGPAQVLPVQTASSSAQFPKYKGASVGPYTNRGFTKIPNDYQEFKSQTQLHFNGKPTTKPKTFRNTVYHPKVLGQIRSDVEIINKKKPIPPLPRDDDNGEDDDSSREGFSDDSYFPKNQAEQIELAAKMYFKEGELESDFKPSKSFPFKDYEGKFGKPKKPSPGARDDGDDDEADEEDEQRREDAGPRVNLAAKYRFPSKAEASDGEAEDEGDSSEGGQRPGGYGAFGGPSAGFDDDDEEEERGPREREAGRKPGPEDEEGRHGGGGSPGKPRPRKERGRSYADDFEDSFRRKSQHGKPKYPHHQSRVSSSEFGDGRARPADYRASDAAPRKQPSPTPSKDRARIYGEGADEPTGRPRGTKYPSGALHEARSSEDRGGRAQEGPKPPTKALWEDSYRSRSGEDASERANYSREESDADEIAESVYNLATRKPLSSSLPDITTRPSTRPITSVKVTTDDSGSSTYSPRVSWNIGVTKTRPTHPDSYSRPPTSVARAPVLTKKSFFQPTLGHAEIFRSLKGI